MNPRAIYVLYMAFSREHAHGEPEDAGFRKRGGSDLPFHAVLREQGAKSALRLFSRNGSQLTFAEHTLKTRRGGAGNAVFRRNVLAKFYGGKSDAAVFGKEIEFFPFFHAVEIEYERAVLFRNAEVHGHGIGIFPAVKGDRCIRTAAQDGYRLFIARLAVMPAHRDHLRKTTDTSAAAYKISRYARRPQRNGAPARKTA